MTKFNVGDRVRFLGEIDDLDYLNEAIRIGSIGVVVEKEAWDNYLPYLVRFDCARPTNGHDDGWWVTERSIEAITEPVVNDAPTSSAPSITRYTVVEVSQRLRFKRLAGDNVVHVCDFDQAIISITLDELREIVKALEEAK